MASYKDLIQELTELKKQGNGSNVNIQAESAARMRLQNQFQSGLDIARYTAAIMRKTYLYKKTFWIWKNMILIQKRTHNL